MMWFWEGLLALPSWLLISAVRGYKMFISPLLPKMCRYQPTCSMYFIGAVEKYGAFWGTLRGLWRIVRCNPFCTGGHDPP